MPLEHKNININYIFVRQDSELIESELIISFLNSRSMIDKKIEGLVMYSKDKNQSDREKVMYPPKRSKTEYFTWSGSAFFSSINGDIIEKIRERLNSNDSFRLYEICDNAQYLLEVKDFFYNEDKEECIKEFMTKYSTKKDKIRWYSYPSQHKDNTIFLAKSMKKLNIPIPINNFEFYEDYEYTGKLFDLCPYTNIIESKTEESLEIEDRKVNSRKEIKNELVPLAYELSKSVYENQLTFTEAKAQLSGNNQMNENSAADYINNFRCLMNGQKFTRSLNAFSMKYFLDKIYQDYSMKGLSNAISALEQHIEYYETAQKVIMHKQRLILKNFTSIVLDFDPDEKEQNDIIGELAQRGLSREDLLKELKEMPEKDTEVIQINHWAYKRDNVTIAKIKLVRGFNCQICDTTILKRDGKFYIEAAHINPKSEKGQETLTNIILLCPNHHKEFDLGKREIIKHDDKGIKFKLNDEPYYIPFE